VSWVKASSSTEGNGLIVTVNEQLSWLLLASVTVYSTVVTPILNSVPLASLTPEPVVAPDKVNSMVSPVQLSDTVGAIPFTTESQEATSVGQLI